MGVSVQLSNYSSHFFILSRSLPLSFPLLVTISHSPSFSFYLALSLSLIQFNVKSHSYPSLMAAIKYYADTDILCKCFSIKFVDIVGK